jgi:hypothetical protein
MRNAALRAKERIVGGAVARRTGVFLLELSTALASWRWWATITPSRSRDRRPRQPRGITERGAVTVDGADSALSRISSVASDASVATRPARTTAGLAASGVPTR